MLLFITITLWIFRTIIAWEWDYYSAVYNNVDDVNHDLAKLYNCTQKYFRNITLVVEDNNLMGIGYQMDNNIDNSELKKQLKDCYIETRVDFTHFSNLSMIENMTETNTYVYDGHPLYVRLGPATQTGYYDMLRAEGRMSPLCGSISNIH